MTEFSPDEYRREMEALEAQFEGAHPDNHAPKGANKVFTDFADIVEFNSDAETTDKGQEFSSLQKKSRIRQRFFEHLSNSGFESSKPEGKLVFFYPVNADTLQTTDAYLGQEYFELPVQRMVLVDSRRRLDDSQHTYPEIQVTVNDIYEHPDYDGPVDENIRKTIQKNVVDKEEDEESPMNAVYTKQFRLTSDGEVYFRHGFQLMYKNIPLPVPPETMIARKGIDGEKLPLADMITSDDGEPKAVTHIRDVSLDDTEFVNVMEESWFPDTEKDGIIFANAILSEISEREPEITFEYDY